MDLTEAENPFAPQSSEVTKPVDMGRSFYEVLEVRQSASRADIRSAYIRMKGSLSPVSGASYSLLDSTDQSEALRELEDAYRTLDDDYLRRKYDLELSSREPQVTESPREPKTIRQSRKLALNAERPEIQEHVANIIQQADAIDGALLQQIRLAVEVDPEEIQTHLKISTYYLKALEEDEFSKLPPLVYVRGFLKSLLEYLGTPEVKPLMDGYSGNLTKWKKKNDKKRS